MIKHNVLIALRSFRKYLSAFIINMVGLSTGLAGVLLIYLWVSDEISFDKFHENGDRLVQVMRNVEGPSGMETRESTPGLLARGLKDEIPEVEMATAVIPPSWFGDGVVNVNENEINVSFQFVEEDFLTMFSYNLLDSKGGELLKDKRSILISDELANKLFGTTDNLVGKSLEWMKPKFSGDFEIAGVFEKPPKNSTAQFDLLFSFDLFMDTYKWMKTWNNTDPYTYVLLREGETQAAFGEKISGYLNEKDPRFKGELFARLYADKHLYNVYENGIQTGGRITYVRLFSLIGVFILIIACINFMNLSTARASKRMKEVGVRKALGSTRKALITQFLSESVLTAFFSLIVAVVVVIALLPKFSEIIGKELSLEMGVQEIIAFLTITLFTGLVAGSYPAFYLSKFNPALVLKGRLKSSISELWIRKGLVIFQFSVSVILIVSVVVLYNQIQYVMSKNLGYKRENVIVFSAENNVYDRMEAFLNEAEQLPGVIEASTMDGSVIEDVGGSSGIKWPGKDEEDKVEFGTLGVNYGLLETLGVQLAEGRTFSKDFGNESRSIIFNEAAIKRMGIEDPIGKIVTKGRNRLKIVGVVKDFHFASLHEQVGPFFFSLEEEGEDVVVSIKGDLVKETLGKLDELNREFKDGALAYTFLDEQYERQYISETRTGLLSRYFAIIAIVISCLGLFGLAAFTAQQRMKEIGIRKVLGASQSGIVYLLSSELTKMILMALVVAIPLSVFITKNWLDTFAYRIALQWWFFVGAAVITVLIAWLTLAVQLVKSARLNTLECISQNE